MARSTYYYYMSRLGKATKYDTVRERIKEIYAQSRERYGYRRITMQLRNDGYTINHKTVRKLMGELGIKCMIRQKKYKSDRGNVGEAAPNVIDRLFNTDNALEKLATDISQMAVGQQKCFLSTVIDMYNGEIVTYDISDRANLKQVMDMLHSLFQITDRLPKDKTVILHSDQGWQYRHRDYQKALKDHGIIQSMSRRGNCLDNAVMENFFGLMKSELLYAKKFNSMQQFKNELVEYIDWYNNQRIKLRLNGMSPVQYRKLHLNV